MGSLLQLVIRGVRALGPLVRIPRACGQDSREDSRGLPGLVKLAAAGDKAARQADTMYLGRK